MQDKIKLRKKRRKIKKKGIKTKKYQNLKCFKNHLLLICRSQSKLAQRQYIGIKMGP